jgi:hypothetical protein
MTRTKVQHRNIPAPAAWDAKFEERPGDDKECQVVNMSNNIIEIPIGDSYVILGAAIDKGIVGAKQPHHDTTVGAIRRARMNPALELYFSGNKPALEVRSRAIIVDLGF